MRSENKTKIDSNRFKESQQQLYDQNLLDDLAASAGKFGFRKPKLIRDLFFTRWLRELDLEPGEKVLDVGCNAGARLEQLRREVGIHGIGIDYSPTTITKGQQSFPELDLQVGDAERLPFEDDSFDAAISFETFEHLPDPDQALSEMARVVRPGGRILIYAISRRNAFTLHWWQYHLSGGRLGTGALKDHLPELLVKPEQVINTALKLKLALIRQVYFHSFFTIIFDEVVFTQLSKLIKIPKSSRSSNSIQPLDRPLEPGRIFKLYILLLRLLSFATWWLDLPWRILKLSDGVMLRLDKPTVGNRKNSNEGASWS